MKMRNPVSLLWELCCAHVVGTLAGDTYHTGILSLPPGRYLIRFLVDGEYRVDDNQEVVCSLGNEYNSLVVQDPKEVTDDEDDEDWDKFDQSDGSDSESQRRALFGDLGTPGFGAKFGSSLLAQLDTSKGPVTITPEMASAAIQQEQRTTFCPHVCQWTDTIASQT